MVTEAWHFYAGTLSILLLETSSSFYNGLKIVLTEPACMRDIGRSILNWDATINSIPLHTDRTCADNRLMLIGHLSHRTHSVRCAIHRTYAVLVIGFMPSVNVDLDKEIVYVFRHEGSKLTSSWDSTTKFLAFDFCWGIFLKSTLNCVCTKFNPNSCIHCTMSITNQ